MHRSKTCTHKEHPHIVLVQNQLAVIWIKLMSTGNCDEKRVSSTSEKKTEKLLNLIETREIFSCREELSGRDMNKFNSV